MLSSLALGLLLQQSAPRAVFLVGEGEYGSEQTLTELAEEFEQELGFAVDLRHSEDGELPPVPAPDEAELLLLFLRFREAEPESLAALDAWLDGGGATLALRTTSHAFIDEPGWFPPRFGGHYMGHADNEAGTRAVASVEAREHPILRGVPRVIKFDHGGTYDTQPLSEGARVLLFGRTEDLPAQPVAWLYRGRFYTSLGAQENFEHEGFRRLLKNAALHLCGLEVPGGGFDDRSPRLWSPPPALNAPADATVLFGGGELDAWRHWDPSVAPRAIHVDERADTRAGGPRYADPRWAVDQGALVARPGFGDLVTHGDFTNAHLHLDFLVPSEPDWVPPDFRGSSGVYLAGRFEVELGDAFAVDPDEVGPGSLHGVAAPLSNPSWPAGQWQSLDVSFEGQVDEPPRASVWWNGVLIHDDVRLEESSPYGFLRPLWRDGEDAVRVQTDEDLELGEGAWAATARFRTGAGGTLVSKCPPEGDWVPNAKALFLRGGRLVFDIGWVGALTSSKRYDDDEWHRVVLTSDDGVARLFVDGAPEGEREDFAAPDEPEFVFKVGAANENFGGRYDGEVEQVAFFDRRLSPDEALALSYGEWPELEPRFFWDPSEEDGPATEAGDLPRGPIRLQADASPVRFANIWVRDLDEVDHAGVIESWDGEAFARGADVFKSVCVACHGEDGMRTHNPKARPFATAPLQNGADPHSLYRTIGEGFRDMPANGFLSHRQRYDLVHYIREAFLRDRNPTQLFDVTEQYLAALPRGRRAAEPPPEFEPRDYGGALGSQVGGAVPAGLTLRLDEDLSLSFDLHTLEALEPRLDGFLELGNTQHYQQRGEGIARPQGKRLIGLASGFGHGGTLDWDRDQRPERGPLPADWLDYHGYHAHGDAIVLSYAVDGREVLDQPGSRRGAGLPVVTRRLSVEAGSTALIFQAAEVDAATTVHHSAPAAEGRLGYEWVIDGSRMVASVGGVPLAVEGDRVVVHFPAGARSQELYLLCAERTPGGGQEQAFELLLANLSEQDLPASPASLTEGGPSRWPQVLLTRGNLGAERGGYALDTLTLPDDNPWNAWLRTSALDFFDDGRAAVSTYGGDVWLVSGIGADLQELRWKRFAAGLFEPMGLRVIDGLVYVTCRDRIVRLHDRNGDDEADFYESFFPDPDVTASFHSFSFDLQTDDGGNLYYAKSGQYTDYALPGAILKVAPDGRSHEVFSTGLRTPNGMGMSSEGLPFVSDNQGNWIPASKITLSRPGGFHGVFKSINTHGPGIATRQDFDRPIVWMPQSLDSSSGGQVHAHDARFGPLAGSYLHTSFGKGWMYAFNFESVGEVDQGAVWKLPHQFDAGVQRARVNPTDGQVYAVGLSGWQGPAGGADGCLQRLRFVGGEAPVLVAARSTRTGLALTFDRALDPDWLSAERFEVKRWNYLWARGYGSAHYSVARPGEEGEDLVGVEAIQLGAEGRRLDLVLEAMGPADQVELRMAVRSADGAQLKQQVYFTVNRLP